MGVSRRSYAALRGVSEAAVRKAIATGRITTLPDGTIDPARADKASCNCSDVSDEAPNRWARWPAN